MSFHVRVFKHNLLKFTRFRYLSLSTDITDTKADNVIAEETQILQSNKKGKIWPDQRLMENIPSVVVSKSTNNGVLLCLATTQSLPGLYTRDDKHIFPLTLADIETLLFGPESARNSRRDDTGHLDYLKPVSYTTDDILTSGSYVNTMDYVRLRDTIISQENISVTLLRCGSDSSLRQHGLIDDVIPDGTHDAPNILLCSSGIDDKNTPKAATGPRGGPTQDQLNLIKEVIIAEVPKFFKKQLEYRMYHHSLIFENNFWQRSKTYQGLGKYAMQMLKFRTMAHCQYTNVIMQVLSISSHIEDGTIIMRWRVSGVPQSKLFVFWKYTPWNYRKSIAEHSKWHDGISTFYLKNDGVIHKHKLDRVMVDEAPQVQKSTSIAATLAVLIGLVPKPSFNDLSSVFMKRTY